MSSHYFGIQIKLLGQEATANDMFMHTEVCVARPEKDTTVGKLKSPSMAVTTIWARLIVNGTPQLFMVRT
jgi:hypothetical protein